MRIFNILLKSDQERVSYVNNYLLKKIPNLEIFPAVEGKTNQVEYLLEDRFISPKFLKYCKRGQLACLLSHLSLWKKIVEERIEKAIILEDDAIIADEFFQVIEDFPKNADFIYLFIHPDSKIKTVNKKFVKGYPTYGTVGYFLTLQTAKDLIKVFSKKIVRTVDETISWYLEHYKRTYYCLGENLVNTCGTLYQQENNKDGLGSTIGETGKFDDPNTLIEYTFYIDQGEYLCFPCCDLGDNIYQDNDSNLKEKYLENQEVVGFNSNGWIKKSLDNWKIDPKICLYLKRKYLKENIIITKMDTLTSKDSSNPLVSIILPTFNRGNKCLAVIQDVLNQTYQNFELLLINDGSNQSQTQIIENFLNRIKDSRIKYIKQNNKGLAVSLNLGLANFNGEYVTWISDDNKIREDFLEVLVGPRSEFTYSAFNIISSTSSKLVNYKYSNTKRLINTFYGMAAFMWKKEIIDKIGRFNTALSGLCEDADFEIRTFLATSDITYINKVLVDYHVGKDTQSYQRQHKMIRVHKIVKDFYNIYIDRMLNKDKIVINDDFENFDESFAKIELTDIEGVKYENQILYISKKYKELVKNILEHSSNRNKKIYGTSLENIQMKKISIVMAYFNRKEQTIRTLNGFEKEYANKYNFEVIIVDDDSKDSQKLDDILSNYSFPIKLIDIDSEEKGDRINPCLTYNKGFPEATGEIVIIQNPECFHVGDILEDVLDKLKEQDYFSYSCFTANGYELTDDLLEDPTLINNEYFLKKNMTFPDELNWYNSPSMPVGYHFCSAIYKSKLNLIGGFDKRFSQGSCFDDDELLLTIKHTLKLNVEIISPDRGFVIHQFHGKSISVNINNADDENIIKQKWMKNQQLFQEIKTNHEKHQFKYPKLLHLYWDGSPLSYLNYLTVLSFNEYHKEWKIIVYLPTKRNTEISWKSHEQKLRYEGTCYLDKLKEVDNLIIQYVSLDEIGFRNDASEVIKSDYFRYYILQRHGGVWSDFDIIYTGSIEEKLNFDEETIIFRCFTDYHYYPIALFIAKPNNKFFKYLLEEARKRYDPDEYQSIGAVMLGNLFPTLDALHEKDLGTIKVCDHEYYLPWAWNQLDEFLKKKDNTLPENNVGIHWFNGATAAKQYAIDLDKRLNNFEETCYLDKFVSKYLEVETEIKIKTVSIVMAYYNKKDQLRETIKRINQTKYDFEKIEIIIVDDCSSKKQRVRSFIDETKSKIKIKIIEVIDKKYYNPCYAYNLGFKEAQGDILIIQNPEVMYVGDCVKYVVDNIELNDWLVFNCYGAGSFTENELFKLANNDDIFNFVKEKVQVGGNSYRKEDIGGWLNHHSKHFVAYHYCAAIYREDLKNKMESGFYDGYKYGLCFDDNDFINYLVYNKFNFKTNEFKKGEPFVIHQYHEKSHNLDEHKIKELWEINQKVFFERCDRINFTREVDIAIRDEKFNPKAIII